MLGQIRGETSVSDSPRTGASVTTTGTQSPGRLGSELPKEATRTEESCSRSDVPTNRESVSFLRVSQSRAMSVCAILTEQPTRMFSLKAIGNLWRLSISKLLQLFLNRRSTLPAIRFILKTVACHSFWHQRKRSSLCERTSSNFPGEFVLIVLKDTGQDWFSVQVSWISTPR